MRLFGFESCQIIGIFDVSCLGIVGLHMDGHELFINRAAMGRAIKFNRFLPLSAVLRDLLVVVVVVVFFLSVTRPKPPLGQITIGTESRNLGCLFAKSCWNNDVREMLRIMFSLL